MLLFTTGVGIKQGNLYFHLCVNHNLDLRKDFISNTCRIDYAKVMICFCQITTNASLSVTLNWYRNGESTTRYFIPMIS